LSFLQQYSINSVISTPIYSFTVVKCHNNWFLKAVKLLKRHLKLAKRHKKSIEVKAGVINTRAFNIKQCGLVIYGNLADFAVS